jgi:hypothetical protein
MMNRSLKVAVQGPEFMAHPYTYIHNYDHLFRMESYVYCSGLLYLL